MPEENSGTKRVPVPKEKAEILKALGKETQGLYSSLGKLEEEYYMSRIGLLQAIANKKNLMTTILNEIKKELKIATENMEIDMESAEVIVKDQ